MNDDNNRNYPHLAQSLESCINDLTNRKEPIYSKDGSLWCNATWDTLLCWPAIPANTSYRLPCPPLRGLDLEKFVTKYCDETGRWAGRPGEKENTAHGYTDYRPCVPFDLATYEQAQRIASYARIVEFIGLSLSLITLVISIVIFSVFRRLQVFRNHIHKQLMFAMLLNVVLRLILYVDIAIGQQYAASSKEYGVTINSTKIVCELLYILLEYLKTVAYVFSFIEGFHLHNTIVVSVFYSTEPKLSNYLAFGWGFPAVHTLIWAAVFLFVRDNKTTQKCLGEYYLQPEYWILDGVRLFALIVNFIFLLRIVGVLWLKVKETTTSNELEQLKKSVKAAMMLIPLLGIPNVLQVIPFQPTEKNLLYFGIFTFCASIVFMFQGFMVAVLYCFTNREPQICVNQKTRNMFMRTSIFIMLFIYALRSFYNKRLAVDAQVIDVVTSAWKRYRLRRLAVDRSRNSTVPASHRGSAENRYTIDQDRLYTSLENGTAASGGGRKSVRDAASPSSEKRRCGQQQQQQLTPPPPSYHLAVSKQKVESTLFRLSNNGDSVCVLVPDSGRGNGICHADAAPGAEESRSRTIGNLQKDRP